MSGATLTSMPRRRRRVSACLAVACVAALAVLGAHEAFLYFGPASLLMGLVLGGRFVGAERIVARRRRRSGPPRRAPRRLPRAAVATAVVSLLARRVHLERGPPVATLPLVA